MDKLVCSMWCKTLFVFDLATKMKVKETRFIKILIIIYKRGWNSCHTKSFSILACLLHEYIVQIRMHKVETQNEKEQEDFLHKKRT